MSEFLFLAILFVVGSLLQNAGKRRRQRTGTLRGPAEAEPAGDGGVLEQFQKALEEMKQANEAANVDEDDEVEAVSREVLPDVRSLEDLSPRAERVVVDQDEAIEALGEKRLEWAEARARPLSREDHRAFDAKIRAPAVVAPAAPDRRAELRRMIVWQEVLGKPVSLRDREER